MIAAALLAVTFVTADGWRIAGDYQAPSAGKPTAILVHCVAAGRGEWAPLIQELAKRGWGTLAIDLRGHGASGAGPKGPDDFRGIDARGEWPQAERDILAAARFLKDRGVGARQLVLIGASIGANLCSRAAAVLKPRTLVLLSPGADYRGVRLAPIAPARSIAAAAPTDAYAHATVRRLKELLPGLTVLEASSGHGAQMLEDKVWREALLKRLTK